MGLLRILVPFDGGILCEDALELACGLVQPQGRGTAVYVVRPPPQLPIGAEEAAVALGQEVLRRATEVGRRHQVTVETKVARAPEGAEGIVAAAQEINADAVVMSHRHKHSLGETMVLSHTASRVLRGAPCRVLVTYRRES